MPITNNILLRNFSGAVGKKFVLRVYNGRTFISRYPYFANGHAPTPGQKIRRMKFKEAVLFAQAVLRDPELKAFYAAFANPPHSSAYHKAISDACTEPVIVDLDSSEYKGSPGQAIRIQAAKRFGIAEVLVRIILPDGQLLEEGEADYDPRALTWTYLATQQLPPLPGSVLQAIAIDLPGNEAILNQLIPQLP